jgi:hypothetical protein
VKVKKKFLVNYTDWYINYRLGSAVITVLRHRSSPEGAFQALNPISQPAGAMADH